MNVEFINPFLSSVSNVLATMATLEVKNAKVKVKEGDLPLGDISVVMKMNSKQARGTLVISFTQPAILGLVQRMLSEELGSIDATAIDLAGELTNMVTGGAKRLLEEQGYDFDMASPVTVVGTGHKIYHNSKAQTIVIPYSSDVGDFYIEMSFDTTP